MKRERPEKPEQRQVSVWLPGDLYELLRARSFELRRTRTDIITEALSGYLSGAQAKVTA